MFSNSINPTIPDHIYSGSCSSTIRSIETICLILFNSCLSSTFSANISLICFITSRWGWGILNLVMLWCCLVFFRVWSPKTSGLLIGILLAELYLAKSSWSPLLGLSFFIWLLDAVCGFFFADSGGSMPFAIMFYLLLILLCFNK